MNLHQLLLAFSSASGVSGLTGALQEAEAVLSSLGEVTCDAMGGLICRIGTGKRTVLLDAHLDEIGCLVTAVDGDFVRVAACGAVDVRTLTEQDVYVHGKETLFGVFAGLPPHLKKETEQTPDLGEMIIDCGLMHDQLVQIVAPGDRVTFATKPAALCNHRLTGKSLDNRAGVAAVVDAAKRLASQEDVTVLVLLSGQEELGCRGAKTAAFACSPDEAIVVDVSFGDSPNVSPRECGKLGNGVMIGVSPVLNRTMIDALTETAERCRIPYQLEVMGDRTGTNADSISLTKCGIPTALLSIPLRNMHTACEIIDEADLQAVSDLIVAYVSKRGQSDA